MTTRILTFTFIAATAGLAFSGCRKDDDNVAGKGGSATLRIIPQHHLVNIDSCRVFIKYNTQDAPGNGVYDDSADVQFISSGLPHMALFPGLKKGNYYLYGRGWDPNISQAVHGGTPFNINNDQPQFDVYLPISEE